MFEYFGYRKDDYHTICQSVDKKLQTLSKDEIKLNKKEI